MDGDKLDQILDNQVKTDEKITAITTMLVGNESLKQKGLVDEVRANSKTRKGVYRAGGFMTGLILVWEFLRDLFS